MYGFLKTGAKKLFIVGPSGRYEELQPTCVLDFYVHESSQRMGIGRALFDSFLQLEKAREMRRRLPLPAPQGRAEIPAPLPPSLLPAGVARATCIRPALSKAPRLSPQTLWPVGVHAAGQQLRRVQVSARTRPSALSVARCRLFPIRLSGPCRDYFEMGVGGTGQQRSRDPGHDTYASVSMRPLTANRGRRGGRAAVEGRGATEESQPLPDPGRGAGFAHTYGARPAAPQAGMGMRVEAASAAAAVAAAPKAAGDRPPSGLRQPLAENRAQAGTAAGSPGVSTLLGQMERLALSGHEAQQNSAGPEQGRGGPIVEGVRRGARPECERPAGALQGTPTALAG